MKSYGVSVDGPLLIERVDTLPAWTASLVGRMVYERDSSTYWIAGDTVDDGVAGWIQFGLNNDSIASNYIRWDDLFDDPMAVSSEDIPTFYRDTTSTVQVSLNSITDDIDGLVDGTLLGDGALIGRHIAFTTDDVPFANSSGRYDVSFETVEQVLNFLRYTTADQVLFLEPHQFGVGIGSSADNVQQALLDIDKHLENLTADSVKALIPSTSVWSSVQSVLDMINSNVENISFTDLVGTPENYGINKQYIKTNGVDTVYFSDIYAIDIICQYPGTETTTVQNALAAIKSNLDTLSGGRLSIDASDVSYDDSPSVGMNNVDDVLDYLLREAFTASNLPEAAQITSVGIGTTDNVQSSLEFLQTEIESLLAASGDETCGSPISPIILSGDATVSLANIGQDYLLLTHTYGGVSDADVAITARIVVDAASQDGDLIVAINEYDVITVDKALLYPGYTITLMAKAKLSPNTTINLTVQSVTEGCEIISVTGYRMLIEPAL